MTYYSILDLTIIAIKALRQCVSLHIYDEDGACLSTSGVRTLIGHHLPTNMARLSYNASLLLDRKNPDVRASSRLLITAAKKEASLDTHPKRLYL